MPPFKSVPSYHIAKLALRILIDSNRIIGEFVGSFYPMYAYQVKHQHKSQGDITILGQVLKNMAVFLKNTEWLTGRQDKNKESGLHSKSLDKHFTMTDDRIPKQRFTDGSEVVNPHDKCSFHCFASISACGEIRQVGWMQTRMLHGCVST